jgi:hypothetical protein
VKLSTVLFWMAFIFWACSLCMSGWALTMVAAGTAILAIYVSQTED